MSALGVETLSTSAQTDKILLTITSTAGSMVQNKVSSRRKYVRSRFLDVALIRVKSTPADIGPGQVASLLEGTKQPSVHVFRLWGRGRRESTQTWGGHARSIQKGPKPGNQFWCLVLSGGGEHYSR